MSRDTLMIKRLKKNYTYSAEQLYGAFGVHSRTLSTWHKAGLMLVKNRPLMVFSEDLREFLRQKVQAKRTKLKLTEFYCMSCKRARQAHEGKVHIEPLKNVLQVKAICPDCASIMNRRHSKKKYEEMAFLMRTITLTGLHMLCPAIRSEKAHLEEGTNLTPSEPSNDTHLYQQNTML